MQPAHSHGGAAFAVAFVLILILTSPSSTEANQGASRSQSAPIKYVKAGEDVQLACNVSKFSGKKLFTLAWHHVAIGHAETLSVPITKDDKVTDDNKYRLLADLAKPDVVGASGKYDLTVLSITDDEAGIFACKVQPLRGKLHSFVFPVFVGREPSVSIFNYSGGRLTSEALYVAENESFSLTCQDERGKPTSIVEWYTSRDTLLASGNETSTLTVLNVSLQRNSTRYECRAKNVYKVSKLIILLIVEAKPAVVDWWPKDRLHTYPMRTETFKCRHRGSPQPTVQWLFKPENEPNFQPLVVFPTTKYYTKNDSNFSLCVRNITRNDIGVYKCVLKNRLVVLTPDPEPPYHNFTLTLAPMKPSLIIAEQNVYSNACFVNWTITASNIDYYVLHARVSLQPVPDSQADDANANAQSQSNYSADYYDNAEQLSVWKNDNFSHIVDGVVYHSPRQGWKLFEGSRVLTQLLPQTNYEVKLEACYLGGCSQSDPTRFRTKDETRPLRSIPFALTIKQKLTEGAARAVTSKSADSTKICRHLAWLAFLVLLM